MPRDKLRIGTILDGFCNGAFGSSSYYKKVVEGIGRDWIVARDDAGFPVFAEFDSPSHLEDYIGLWIEDGTLRNDENKKN